MSALTLNKFESLAVKTLSFVGIKLMNNINRNTTTTVTIASLDGYCQRVLKVKYQLYVKIFYVCNQPCGSFPYLIGN